MAGAEVGSDELPSCFASRSPFFLAKAGEGLGVGIKARAPHSSGITVKSIIFEKNLL
jgi:hypothetical protein